MVQTRTLRSGTTRKAARRTYRPERSRARILKAAEELFSRQGFEGTTIRQVASRAGVPSSLLYHHFGDKRGLLLAVQRELSSHFVEAMAGLRAADPPSREGVAEFLGRFFDVLAEHADVFRLSAGFAQDPRTRKAEYETLRVLMRAGEDYLARGIEARAFQPIVPRDFILAFFGMLKAIFVEDGFRWVLYEQKALDPELLAGLKRSIVGMALITLFGGEPAERPAVPADQG